MWQLDGHLATADFENVKLTVGLSTGDRKVLIHTAGDNLIATLWDMPLVATQPLVDCYVRGDDLVCLLGPTEGFPFSTQLYWTLRHVGTDVHPVAAVSLLISIRTDLLDTHPTIDVHSKAPHRGLETINIDGGPAYVVPVREQLTLVDFATPEDCASQQATEQDQGALHLERTLFDHFLEKGVIRSGRLFAAVMAGDIEAEAAASLCNELLAAELPLTT